MFGSIKDDKVNVHGVGLGLVICKLIVKKFGGYIDFISKHKKGSTFFFTFETEPADQNLILERAESSNLSINSRIMKDSEKISLF